MWNTACDHITAIHPRRHHDTPPTSICLRAIHPRLAPDSTSTLNHNNNNNNAPHHTTTTKMPPTQPPSSSSPSTDNYTTTTKLSKRAKTSKPGLRGPKRGATPRGGRSPELGDGRHKRVWKACERCRMKKTKVSCVFVFLYFFWSGVWGGRRKTVG